MLFQRKKSFLLNSSMKFCNLTKGQEKKENVFEKYQTQLGLEKNTNKKIIPIYLELLNSCI